jgi:hypothetical protein
MSTTELVTFEIRTSHFGEFVREFERLAKKAKKLKLVPPTYEVVGEKVVPAVIGALGEVTVPAKHFQVVTVSGQSPKIAGWTFVAVLQHEEKGNIVHRVPCTDSIKVEKDLRAVKPFCNHCKTERRRLDTYVVAHEDGRQLQVGRNCLRDFTGHDSPEVIARWAELLGAFVESVGEDEDGLGGGWGGGVLGWSLAVFLHATAASIRENGWLSRTKARSINESRFDGSSVQSTADLVLGYLTARAEDKRKFITELTAADLTRATVALEFAKAYFEKAEEEDKELSDYEHNLRLIIEGNSTDARGSGLTASIIAFSERLMGKELERKKAQQSEFQGEVKKTDIWTLVVTRVVDLTHEIYGTSHINLMQDEQGNRFSWKTKEALSLGSIYRVVGTVKEHKVYIPRDAQPGFAGIKQTVLTRCWAIELVKPARDSNVDDWSAANAKRVEVESELAAEAEAAKAEKKAAQKAARAAKKAEKAKEAA